MLRGILGDLSSMEGVIAVAIVDEAGFVIETTSEVINSYLLGPMTATSIAVAKSFLCEIGRKSESIMIEGSHGFMSVSTMTDDESLVVIANSKMNIGKIRYKVKKMRPSILAAMM